MSRPQPRRGWRNNRRSTSCSPDTPLKSRLAAAETPGVANRRWVIVARQEMALFEALAAAFWNRKEHSVVLDRRVAPERRLAAKPVRSTERRVAPPLDLVTGKFCIVEAAQPCERSRDGFFPRGIEPAELFSAGKSRYTRTWKPRHPSSRALKDS